LESPTGVGLLAIAILEIRFASSSKYGEKHPRNTVLTSSKYGKARKAVDKGQKHPRNTDNSLGTGFFEKSAYSMPISGYRKPGLTWQAIDRP
jgi:hypothetical protein